MLRTNSFRITLLSAACAAGLVAQGAPEAANPRFNDPPPPPQGAYAPQGQQGGYAPQANVPANLTLPAGAFLTVRVNQWLSSDRNQSGDTFYATLAQPVIVDGVVVARRGSAVTGRVSDVKKSHSDSGSHLGLQLTSLSLVDGQQVPIQSQVIDRNGSTMPGGQQVGTVATTTAIGAIIGAAAGGGLGAGIGATAGAVAGGVGIAAAKGRPSEVYPETMLTFRMEAPLTISTAQSAGAFHYSDQEDYGQNGPGPQPRMAVGGPRPVGPPMGVYGGPYPYYDPYYSPYYYGGGFSVFVGPRFYGGGRYYRGFRR